MKTQRNTSILTWILLKGSYSKWHHILKYYKVGFQYVFQENTIKSNKHILPLGRVSGGRCGGQILYLSKKKKKSILVCLSEAWSKY